MTEQARRALGRTGFEVSPVGMGTARLGAFWQGRGVREGRRALDTALDAGLDLFDTADCYARGLSERLVGRATSGRDVCVMTKVGLLKTPVALRHAARSGSGRSRRALRGLTRGPGVATCFEGGYVLAAARACLRRQGAAALDVLLLHEPSPEDLRDVRFLPAMETLVASGDVRAWGASVRDLPAARAALGLPGLALLQVPVSAVRHDVVEGVREAARAADVALVGIAALGDGDLLGRAVAARPGLAPARLVAELGRAALDCDGVTAVLLGMSSAAHVTGLVEAWPEAGRDDRLAADLRTA